MPVAIGLIFFLSGAASLVYEVVWIRQLSVVFGATTYAIATVLAVFMGGLSIGSVLFGRYADRMRSPLVAYALLEVGIGVYGMFVADLFELLRSPYIYLYRLELPHSVLIIWRALLACCVLLPPTILMGGTLPVLARFLVRSQQDTAQRISLLYFVNTAGAVAGCAAAGFYLIENFGNSGSTRVAIATNFILAGGAIAVAMVSRNSANNLLAPQHPPSPSDSVSRLSIWLSLTAIGVSGFVSLAHEVLWSRALLRYIYNSTYAFTTMLVVFLAGLALGSALYSRLPFRKRNPLLLFALLEFGVAAGFVVSLLLFPRIPDITTVLTGEKINSFAESIGLLAFSAALTFLFPALCLGAALPAATDICARNSSRVGGTVGNVYAVNTLGAILGSVASTFVLIPRLGMNGTVALLTACTFAVAVLLLYQAVRTTKARYLLVPMVAASAAIVAGIAQSDVFRRTFTEPLGAAQSQLVYYREGATDTIGVLERNGQRSIVYEDMRGTAATWSYQWNFFLGHLPVLLHPGEPKTALHICFGVGNSLAATAAHEFIESVDSVELSPHVLDVANYFWTNGGVIDNPKVNTIIDDGRNFVMASERVYDIILLEPPETFTAGVIHLYTTEFYSLVRERLAEDGVFMQWVPVGESPADEERMLFRSFYEVFPNASAWTQLSKSAPVLLIAGKGDLRFDYERIKERMSVPRIQRDMAFCDLFNPEDVLSLFLFGPPELAAFVDGVTAVVDDKTVLDYSMPRYIGSGYGLGSMSHRVQRGGVIPFSAAFSRGEFYENMRVSCMPYLVNYPPEKHDEIEASILQRVVPDGEIRPIPESDWERWAD